MVEVRVPFVCLLRGSRAVGVALFMPIYCASFHAVCELFHCTPLVGPVCRPPAAAATYPQEAHTELTHSLRRRAVRRVGRMCEFCSGVLQYW
jgi:hypothetical protein